MRNFLKAVIGVMALIFAGNCANAASASWKCNFVGIDEPFTFIAELGTGKGKFVGNQGTADVVVVEGARAISFLELLQSGAVQVTTIVQKTGDAAHSRNTIQSGSDRLLPSQYMGKCQPWN